ncbi:MAG: hypothetical protein H7829_17015 [Magnetococcus sp. THC-1_WYH]
MMEGLLSSAEAGATNKKGMTAMLRDKMVFLMVGHLAGILLKWLLFVVCAVAIRGGAGFATLANRHLFGLF